MTPEETTSYQRMRLVSKGDYAEFVKSNDSIAIGKVDVRLIKEWNIEKFQPENYSCEEYTVWSFPVRGSWATHSGDYRGNWTPFVPRNIIERYTRAGDVVCDPMVGGGTTMVECKLTGRNGVGVDINPAACMLTMNRLDFEWPGQNHRDQNIKIYNGDARNLNEIEDGSVDLVATHPPYCGIISYSGIPADLSNLGLEDFVHEMSKVAKECFRILKSDKYCGILIGDSRKHRHYVPIHIGILNDFLDAGFILSEDIIKLQHNTKSARERWGRRVDDFYKIAHEHLYVFRKPGKDEKTSELKYSKRWW